MKKDIPRDQAHGPLLTFKWVRTVKERRKTVCQTTLYSRMRRNSRISVANVNEDSVCCAVASLLNFALFNLIVVINKHSSESVFHTAMLKSLHCRSFWSVSTWGCRADVFETEQVLLESRGEFLVSARVVDILQRTVQHFPGVWRYV